MTTTSTTGWLAAIRTQLLTNVHESATLDDVLTALYIKRAPDKAVFPYGIMRIVDDSTNPNYDANRLTIQLEVMIHGNKDSHATVVEDAADLCDIALNEYVDSSSGITWSRARSRSTAPATSDPAYRENSVVRLLYELVVYPLFLNPEE
jgi:hypothetical protein